MRISGLRCGSEYVGGAADGVLSRYSFVRFSPSLVVGKLVSIICFRLISP